MLYEEILSLHIETRFINVIDCMGAGDIGHSVHAYIDLLQNKSASFWDNLSEWIIPVRLAVRILSHELMISIKHTAATQEQYSLLVASHGSCFVLQYSPMSRTYTLRFLD